MLDALTSVVYDGYFKLNEICKASLGSSCGVAADSIRFRLQPHGNIGTGDAMLWFNALFIARASRAGMLQDYAIDACAIRAALSS